MIDWVNSALKCWGPQKRRLLTLRVPIKSIAGRVMDEGPAGAAIHSGQMDPQEGFTGKALEASLAMRRAIEAGKLDERGYETIFVHYCFRFPVKAKLQALEVGRTTYYETINRVHRALEPYFP